MRRGDAMRLGRNGGPLGFRALVSPFYRGPCFQQLTRHLRSSSAHCDSKCRAVVDFPFAGVGVGCKSAAQDTRLRRSRT